MIYPFNIVSLWQVIQINSHQVLSSFSYLGAAIKHLELGRSELIAAGDGTCTMQPEQFADIMNCGLVIGQTSKNLELLAAKAAADRLLNWMKSKANNAGQFSTDDMGQLCAFASQMLASFSDEMDAKLMFVMPSKHAPLYKNSEPLFGEKVDDAFPKSVLEIADAGKCCALGQWTACVMHLMRALEPAIEGLCNKYDVPTGQNWNTSFDQITKKLKEVRKKADGKQAERTASELIIELKAVKNAWRNYAMHGQDRYNEEEAVEIYTTVRRLMIRLASFLCPSENTPER